jgi:hypothetical protein
MKRYIFLAILLVIALGVGLVLGSSPDEPSAYELERSSIDIEMARTMLPFQIAFRVLLGAIVLLTIGGVGWGMVRWLHRRADTVYPNHAGLYPIREGQIGGAKVFHDPNRTLTGTTVYASDVPQLEVQHPVPQGQAYAQQQVTAQAQAAQVLRAAVSGTTPLNAGDRSPLELMADRRVSRPLPEVTSLDLEPSHIERLLLEDGDDVD